MNTKKIARMLWLSALFLVLFSFSAYAATVYTTETGKKYHSTSECSGLSNAKNIFEDSESNAINKGLEKCSLCWKSNESSSVSKTTAASVGTAAKSSDSKVKTVKLSAKSKTVKVNKKLKINLLNNNKKVKWYVSNKKAKIVKKTKKYVTVKGLKKGKVTITAKVGNKKYKYNIKVK